MSNIGQVAVTLAGAYVGGMVGMPGLGASLGNLVGQALFPTKLPTNVGPQIADQQVTTSAIGAAWPWVFGQDAVAGNLLWKDKVVNHPHTTEAGGKGGPTQKSIHYTATVSYAVGLCYCYDAPITGITRMWRNEKVVYDVRPQQEGETDTAYAERVAASEAYAETFTLYLGTADQLPDPTIEAVKGVGNTPAYRNRAYIVHIDEDVTDTGGAIPNRRYEVVTAGDDATATVVQHAAAVLHPWALSQTDPRTCKNDHEYAWPGYPVRSTLQAAIDDAIDSGELAESFTHLLGWSSDERRMSLAYAPTPGERVDLYLHFNKHRADPAGPGYRGDTNYQPGFGTSCGIYQPLGVGIDGHRFWWSGLDEDGVDAANNRRGIFRLTKNTGDMDDDEEIVNYCSNFDLAASVCYQDRRVLVRRKPRMPAPPCLPRCDDPFPLLPENPNYCAIGGRVESMVGYAVASGSFKALANYRTAIVEGTLVVTDYPLGPVVISGSADDTQEAWEAAYAAALAAGSRIRSGLVYGIDYPVVPAVAYRRSYDQYALQPVPPTVGSIVKAICERVKVPADRIDVSDLADTLPGYSLSTLMTARDGIQPLQAYQFFDCVESDALLKFPKRGKPIVLTLNSDDLGARFAGETAPPLVSTQIQQAVELPRQVRVHYKMGAKDYQPGMQQSPPRMTTDSVNAKDVQLAINMADDKAAQIAQVIHQDDWWGRESYETIVSPALLQLECADAIGIPVEGQVERARIVNVNMAPPFSPLKFSLRRDDDGVYVSHAVGAAAAPSGDSLGVAGPTSLLIVDGPALDGNANDAGVYVAAWGQFSRWAGAQVMRSIDGGASYKDAVTIVTPATVGRVVGVLAAGPSINVWDYESVLVVDMEHGVLSASTQGDVLNGANPAFLGADGRWEALQYVDATLLGEFSGKKRYQVTTMLRGRRGTEWAQSLHAEGDWFVVVGPGMARIAGEDADIGRLTQWKAVTLDMMEETAASQAFTGQGVALMPYSVVQLAARRLANNDIEVTWNRRARLGVEWQDSIDVPLNEASEAYRVEIFDGAGNVVRSVDVTEPRLIYVWAHQQTDFGRVPESIRVRARQISQAVGPGYASESALQVPLATDAQGNLPSQPAETTVVRFIGDFSADEVFLIGVNPNPYTSYTTYTLEGAGKSSFDDFADELAALLAADFPALTVSVDGPEVTIYAPGGIYVSGRSIVADTLGGFDQQALPAQSQVPQLVGADLYSIVSGQWTLAPADSSSYRSTGIGRVSFQVYGRTWAAQKAMGYQPVPITVSWTIPNIARDTLATAIGGLADAINADATLGGYSIDATLTLDRPQVVIRSFGDHEILQSSISSMDRQTGTHPSGYAPKLTLQAAGQPGYPSGTTQVATLSFSTGGGPNQLTTPPDGWVQEGMIFKVTLDGVDFVFEAEAGDEGQLYFDAAYDDLKVQIEGTGDYTVRLQQGTNNVVTPAIFTYGMEIERNLANAPFTFDAYASYGGRVVIEME